MSLLLILSVVLLSVSQSDGRTFGQQQADDIIAKLSATKQYNYVVNYLKQAKYAAAVKLADGKPKTFFAPTDKALDAVPRSVWNAVKNNPARITNFLKYHFVPGYYPAKTLISDLKKAKYHVLTLFALTGQKVLIHDGPGNSIQVDVATVTARDLLADGTTAVHGINQIL